MRTASLILLAAALPATSTLQGAGLFTKLIWGDAGRAPLISRSGGVKMLELEVVRRPAVPVAEEFATLQFRVRQLSNPDPQYVGPPVRLRRYSLSGIELGQEWLRPNGAGIYEISVPMRESRRHYLYFETGDQRTILAKVPWVVLRSAE